MLDDARGETVSQAGNGEPGTKEAEALAAALNHSAERVQTLWFSFLTFMLYLAIATGTTTHRMLFLEEPLNLPVLNIKLPLLGFYILTPIIFVVFHFYVLLNLVLLARTAKSFEDALVHAFPEDDEARESFRMRIENTLFVQLLVGGRLEREGFNAKLLSLMALITLALAPVAVLLYLQIKFLPYHSEWITWWHRGLLFVDLLLVWTLWPGYRSGWGVRLWPKSNSKLGWPGVLSVVILAYAIVVATFPDERIYLATNWLWASRVGTNARAKITPDNTLYLLGQDLIDDAKLTQIEKNETSLGAERWEPVLSLTGRDLTGADLSFANVQHVDFSGAILNRAQLISTSAKKAVFYMAQLQGTSFFGTQLEGAMLQGAQLQGALLQRAQLQGVSLEGAQLRGASLTRAQLQGVSLKNAQLQSALLEGAQLQGTLLDGAQLQGAVLDGARLQGALLREAQLQGASLARAQVQGAWFGRAQLQGTSLDRAELEGATFENTYVWRADARGAVWKETRVVSPITEPRESCSANAGGCEWTLASFERLKRLVVESTPENYRPQIVIRDPQLRERLAVLVTQTSNISRTKADELVEELAPKGKEVPAKSSLAPKSERVPAMSSAALNEIRRELEIVTDKMLKDMDALANPPGARGPKLADSTDYKARFVDNLLRTLIRKAERKTIEQTLDPTKALEGEEEMAKVWANQGRSSPASEVYEKSLAEQWRKTGCAAEGAPHVLHGLVARLSDRDTSPFRQQSDAAKALASAFLDEAHCAGAHGLSEDDKAELKKIAASAAPQARKS
jgi:uncharacterized protein YjbI with pentapeptide repeats